jgi:N-formylglutamate amidohydrolase
VFDLVRPARDERHVVVEIPHAGLAIPDDVRAQLRVEPAEVLRDADLFVDRLWTGATGAGASMLVANVSRYVVDLNRAEDDVDRDVVPDHPAPRPTQSRGVVWRTTTDGLPALVSERLPYALLEARLARYHRPYHAALAAEIDRKVACFGRALLVAAHSMPSANRPGGPRRADVVPGSRGGTTTDRRVLEVIESHFRGAGLSVRHDDPYRGGFTTQRYGRPLERVHAVQIELNRALYVDERTSQPDEPRIAWLATLMTELVRKLATIEL